jgi:hypothetical protein
MFSRKHATRTKPSSGGGFEGGVEKRKEAVCCLRSTLFKQAAQIRAARSEFALVDVFCTTDATHLLNPQHPNRKTAAFAAVCANIRICYLLKKAA